MSTARYTDEIQARATSSQNLSARLQTNAKGQNRDFHAWVMRHLAPQAGEHVLDVGCGTGAQALPVSKAVGKGGSVSATDFSAESVKELKSRDTIGNIEVVAANMDTLSDIVAKFSHKIFDLAQSTYAIYYADDAIRVAETMHSHLRDGGRLALAVPCLPHELVELSGRFTTIPVQTQQSLEFGWTILKPWFHQTFWEPSIHLFKNLVTVASVDDLLASFRSTVYYDKAAEEKMVEVVAKDIRDKGAWTYTKNAMMLCGTRGN